MTVLAAGATVTRIGVRQRALRDARAALTRDGHLPTDVQVLPAPVRDRGGRLVPAPWLVVFTYPTGPRLDFPVFTAAGAGLLVALVESVLPGATFDASALEGADDDE